MRHLILKSLLFLGLAESATHGLTLNPPTLDLVCCRFYDQWRVSEEDKQKLQKKYKIVHLLFNEKGQILI